MAWYSQNGVQQTPWQGGYPPPASYAVAARHRPCDSQEYAYSQAWYTNYGYTTAAQPPITPMSYPTPHSAHVPDAQTREPVDFRSWAAQRVEHANRVALWAEQCEAGLIQHFGGSGHQRVAGRSPHTAPGHPEAHATSPETAGAPRAPRQASNGEEAARQSMPAAAPPPRPARSIARSRPPPIPPPSTRPRASTKTGDALWEDREAKTASSATTWPEPASTPARPPPPPARSTARLKVSLPREDARVDALPCTTSAQAISAGDPGRTSPTNDRHVVSSTPTANAPSTRLAVPIAIAPLSRALPPPPSRLIGPRNPFSRVENRVATEEDDVPHDVVRPRIIEGRGQEGEEEGGRTRMPGGAGASARSVRGTRPSVSHTADRDFSCDFAPSRATGALPRAVTTVADVTERSKSTPAPSALYQGTDRTEQDRVISTPSTLDSSASGTTRRKRDGHLTSTIPSHPSPFISAMPPSRSGPPARAPPSCLIRPTARISGSRTAQSTRVEEAVKDDGRGAGSGSGPSAPIPPIRASAQRSPESAISRPLQVLSARIVSPLVDAQERGEYTSMNNIHLARAPAHPATRHEQEGREGLFPKRVGRPPSLGRGNSGTPRATARAAKGNETPIAPPRSVLEPAPLPSLTLRTPLLRPAFDPATHPPSTPVEVHVPPPRPLKSTARHSNSTRTRREGMIEPPAIPSPLSREIADPPTSHIHDELTDSRDSREGEGGKRSATTCPGNTSYALARHAPQYRRTREGGQQLVPATSTPPMPFPSRPRPAPLKHPTPTIHSPSIPVEVRTPAPSVPRPLAAASNAMSPAGRARRSARTAPPLTDARAHNEYTSANPIRLARAPTTAHLTNSAVPRVDCSFSCEREVGGRYFPVRTTTSSLGREETDPGARAPQMASLGMSAPAAPLRNITPPQGVLIHATNHPPPPHFIPSSSQVYPTVPSPASASRRPPPPPAGWPFPMSAEELGWVLAAVVMARNMDREEERRQQEYDDNDYLSMWEPHSEDEGDGDATSHDNNSPATFSPAPRTTLSERDDTGTVTYDGGYADTIADSASPVPSLATAFTCSDHDNADIHDWDESSDLAFNEPSDFIYDNEYEQDSDGQISDEH